MSVKSEVQIAYHLFLSDAQYELERFLRFYANAGSFCPVGK